MKLVHFFLLALLLIIHSPENTEISAQGRPLQTMETNQAFAQLPTFFEANVGQADSSFEFIARCDNHTLYLRGGEAIFALHSSGQGDENNETHSLPLQLSLVNGNRTPVVTGEGQLPGKSNYLIGDDPETWHVNVPHYGQVRYEDVYNGIDVVYHINSQHLQYDLGVATLGFELMQPHQA